MQCDLSPTATILIAVLANHYFLWMRDVDSLLPGPCAVGGSEGKSFWFPRKDLQLDSVEEGTMRKMFGKNVHTWDVVSPNQLQPLIKVTSLGLQAPHLFLGSCFLIEPRLALSLTEDCGSTSLQSYE